MFGLTNSEGNHGEDVKEYYFYLDSTPTHSYARMLYKYPQAAFPYEQLVAENRRRSRNDFEYELLDTGVFDEDRYWDVYVEFAKADPEDTLIRITATNRGPGARPRCTCVPQLWFRNTWCARRRTRRGPSSRPAITTAAPVDRRRATRCSGKRYPLLRGRGRAAVHRQRDEPLPPLGPAQPDRLPEGRHQRLTSSTGAQNAVNPARKGTKSAFHSRVDGRARAERDAAAAPERAARPASSPIRSRDFDQTFAERKREADEFYARLIPAVAQRGRHQRRPPGLRRAAVDEAGLRLRRRAAG